MVLEQHGRASFPTWIDLGWVITCAAATSSSAPHEPVVQLEPRGTTTTFGRELPVSSWPRTPLRRRGDRRGLLM